VNGCEGRNRTSGRVVNSHPNVPAHKPRKKEERVATNLPGSVSPLRDRPHLFTLQQERNATSQSRSLEPPTILWGRSRHGCFTREGDARFPSPVRLSMIVERLPSPRFRSRVSNPARAASETAVPPRETGMS